MFTNTRSVFTHEHEAGATRFVSCGFLDPEAFAAERVSDRGVKKLRKVGKPPPTQCEDYSATAAHILSLLGIQLLIISPTWLLMLWMKPLQFHL